MTTAFAAQAVSLALAAVMTVATVSGANALAQRGYRAADAVAMTHVQVLAAQTVVIVGHRV